MKYLKFVILLLLSHFQLAGQNITLIKDSIMDKYMRSGFATKNFRPTGKFDENNKRTGKWLDYEVTVDGSYQSEDGMPMKTIGNYLLYGEGQFSNGQRTGLWAIYVIENPSLKKILSKKVAYSDGKENGNFTYYYPDGSTAQKGNYVDGSIEDSVYIFYQDQNLFARQYFRNDKKEGLQKYYYPSGKLNYIFNYHDGIREGLYEAYYENGNKKESFVYKDDKIDGSYKYYYENGNLWTEKMYSNGLLMNVIRLLDINGKDLDAGTLVNGNGTVNYYTLEGKVYSRVTYKNGVEVKQ